MFCITITDKKSILKGDGVTTSSITSNKTLIENMYEILSSCFMKSENIEIIMKDEQLKQICITDDASNKFKSSSKINKEIVKPFCKMSRDGSHTRVDFKHPLSFTNQSYSMIDCLFSLMNNTKMKKTEMGEAVNIFMIESIYYINDFLAFYENGTEDERYYDEEIERVLVKDMMRILSVVYLYEFYENKESLLGAICAHGMHHTIIYKYFNQINQGRHPQNVNNEKLEILLQEYLLYVLQRK